METFPNILIVRYQSATNKLKKFKRVVFKRFAPNVADVCLEFNQIAIDFNNSYLPEYAGLSWIGASKCEKVLGNTLAEVDYLLKAARAFKQAEANANKLKLKSNQHEHLEGALKCYYKAICKLDDDNVMKAAIIRELKCINQNYETTSNFISPSHRIYDLEQSAIDNIKNDDYVGSLDKLTEIYDDIMERNIESLYGHVLSRNEITRILLLLILELPPSRQAPSNIKLMERYAINSTKVITSPVLEQQHSNSLLSPHYADTILIDLPCEFIIIIKSLIIECQLKNSNNIINMLNKIQQFKFITNEQQILLNELINKFNNNN